MIYTIKDDTTALNFICRINKGISKSGAKKIIKYSTITCDGEKIKVIPSTMFKQGQKIEISKNTANQKAKAHPDKKHPIVIKYEDEYILVAIKPASLLSCKNKTQTGVSFDKMLEAFVSKRDHKKTFLWIVHRIDREVEGLLIFAKSEKLQQKIKDNWSSVTKRYLALTENRPPLKTGKIESWLKDDFKHKMIVSKTEIKDYVFAITEYKYLKSFGKHHLLEIVLHTGKKNQIRAQLGSINCPIVGDRQYGADNSVVRQIRLVAYQLEFAHPITGKNISLKYLPKPGFYAPSKNNDENYKIWTYKG
ncbi:MAG: RluA family pseudouridine synthase [Bacteriovoracaceae bacterium]|nr:RluA family pseudouridine synthase [Bacteriovoracaceae bacterium]